MAVKTTLFMLQMKTNTQSFQPAPWPNANVVRSCIAEVPP